MNVPKIFKLFKEGLSINIEIKRPNRIKDFFHKILSKLEDLLFSIIIKLPEKLIPHFFMEFLDRYTTKRINQLQHQQVKQNWRNMFLEDAVKDINNRQRYKKEAPTED